MLGQETCKSQYHHLRKYILALSNAQNNAAHLKPHNTVVKLFLYSLAFASYRVEIITRKRGNVETDMDASHVLSCIHVEDHLALSSVQCALTS